MRVLLSMEDGKEEGEEEEERGQEGKMEEEVAAGVVARRKKMNRRQHRGRHQGTSLLAWSRSGVMARSKGVRTLQGLMMTVPGEVL